jgi:putative nucleotidyltransferase with HDIG domain
VGMLELHMANVFKLSNLIGQGLGLNQIQLNELSLAASLHDIGKLKIPEEILYKSTKLTNKEFELMKMHSNFGAEMLKNAQFSTEVIKAVLYHHEKFNGHGYPKGIKGAEIPLFSRIISIADAFDAMTTQRSYNTPKSIREALKEINNNSGTQFDPLVVNEFNKIINLFNQSMLTLDIKYNRIKLNSIKFN